MPIYRHQFYFLINFTGSANLSGLGGQIYCHLEENPLFSLKDEDNWNCYKNESCLTSGKQ